MVEKKIARICWNNNYWKKPSGLKDKSINKDTYENDTGFGWEEWLFDTEKIIDNYHYGFIQAINYRWKKYEGNIFDISLFTINGRTKEKWWIGEIRNVEIISPSLSDKIYKKYINKGWVVEMKTQLKEVNAKVEKFVHGEPDYCFNLRYQLKDLNLLDRPLKFDKDDKTLKATYTSTLFNLKQTPNLDASIDEKFIFKAGHNKDKPLHTKRVYKLENKDVDLFHNRMQNSIYTQLVKIYGKNQVSTELDTGWGSKIDIVVEDKGNFIFYELKTGNSLKVNIREGLSQLIEYCFYPREEIASKLIIVSQLPITEDAIEYLSFLRERLGLNIYYQQFDLNRNSLIS